MSNCFFPASTGPLCMAGQMTACTHLVQSIRVGIRLDTYRAIRTGTKDDGQ